MPFSKLKNKPNPNLAQETAQVFQFEAIGTQWTITIEQVISKPVSQELYRQIEKRINEFDVSYSRFRDDSLVTLMAKKVGKYKLPEDAEPMFELYAKLYELTNGTMTPLIGQLVSDAGYDAKYSLKPGALKPTPKWAEVMEYNFPYLNIKKPVLLDFGAAGKGYLVDIVAEIIEHSGISHFCINAGGDILNRNVSRALSRIGLEHPSELDEVVGIAHVNNNSICGSAPNRRIWSIYSHIINPDSHKSPKHIAATWVVAKNTLIADGLATALFFTDAAELQVIYDFEYVIINSDLSLQKSVNFPAEFFVKEFWPVK
jgi:thiamine biosynthesis lipoprotein